MPSTALSDFVRILERSEKTRSRMERLFAEKRLAVTDLNAVYESLFLRSVTGFEVFLEKLFFEILDREKDYPSRRRVALRMETNTKQARRDVLFEGRDYLDWLPIKKTIDRSEVYLLGGRPFSDLSDADKSMISTITVIRNAIAHRGDHSQTTFRKKVIGSTALRPSEKRPAGFLRSAVSSGQNRFQTYTFQLGRIARFLS